VKHIVAPASNGQASGFSLLIFPLEIVFLLLLLLSVNHPVACCDSPLL
jgi:hypothetical protein